MGWSRWGSCPCRCGGGATATTTGTASGAGTSTAGTSLTSAPPSQFTKKVVSAGASLAAEGKKEAAAKQEALPEFKAKIGSPEPAAGSIEAPQSDRGLDQGGVGADATAPNLRRSEKRKHKKKKPGGDMKAAQGETPPDVLARLFAESLGRIDTTSTVSTNPGPAPTIAFQGGSDPARAGTETTEVDGKIAVANAETAAAIAARPGSDEIQPITIDQAFTPAPIEMPDVPEISGDAAMAEYEAKLSQHGPAVGDAADGIQGADFDQKLDAAQAEIDAAVQTRDADYAAKVDEATQAVDAENLKAADDQDKAVATARETVVAEHAQTRTKQDRELEGAKGKSDRAKKDAEKKIEKRRRDDDKVIGKKYKDADRKAAAEKSKAESKAEAEKAKGAAKANDASWFNRAASAIGDFVDAIATKVTTIFDTLSTVVSGLLNAVKDAAMSIIDQAISFATSTLDQLGGLLKGLVDSLIGDIFPGLAAALNEFIDSTVASAKEAVTAIGEGLKTAVAAAVDGLNSGIQLVISAYKTAITAALAVASAIISGDWEKALLVLLEGALELAGVDKSQFYGLVGQGTDTLKSIVDDPGAFVGNMIDSVGQGFSQFADNFGTHLMGGAVDWLTGSLGEAGVTLPETWDASGIFTLVLDVMGVSGEKLRGKVEEKVGEDNMAMLDEIWELVQSVIDGGMSGLWEHVQGKVGDLWSGLLDSALGFLMEKVVTAAVTKVASMFSPVGAIVQAVITAWNVYKFVQEQAQKISSLVENVMSSMAQIVAGQLGAAAGLIEGSLANLVPVAISLLANLLGLGGISQKVKEIIEGLQERVDSGVDFALDKFIDLGTAAFNAVAGTFGGTGADPAAEAAGSTQAAGAVGGDASKLPKATVATTIGGMNIGWDAGGNAATSTLSGGPFAGKIAAESIGKMTAQADLMEGDGKSVAMDAIGTARSQVMAVDSRGGAYMRGEALDLAPIKASIDLLAATILGASNAIGDETGGDKAASVANHEQMAGGVESAMGAAVGGSLTYEQWFDTLKQRATQQEGANQGSLESDVRIEVDMAANVTAALAQGEFKIDIKIAPNDTTEDTSVELGSVDFDPQATLEHAGLEKEKVQDVFGPIAEKLGMSSGLMLSHLNDIWVRTMTRLNGEFPRLDASRTRGENHRSGRSDLESKASQALIDDLKSIGDDLQLFMRAQEQLFASNSSWAFWSGHPAKDVAAKGAQVTLEKSALGAIFEGYSKPLDIHYPELWSAVSRAYVRRAASDFKNRTFRAFAGNIQDRSVWNQVEQPLFQQLAEQASDPVDITFYACAGTPIGNGRYNADYTKSHGGCDGVFTSAPGLGSRQPIQDKAAKFFEAIIVGKDPEMSEIADPLKDKKDRLNNLIAIVAAHDPATTDWVHNVRWAAEQFDELCGPDNTLVTHSTTKRDLDNVSDAALEAIKKLDFAGLTDPSALKSKASTYSNMVTEWRSLVPLMANCYSRSVATYSSRVDGLEAAAETANLAIEVYEHPDRTARSWYAEKIPVIHTKRSGLWTLTRSELSDDFAPIWVKVFNDAEAALRAGTQFTDIGSANDSNTDNLWARDGVALLDHVKAERIGWLELSRYTGLGERGGRAVFNPVLERINQSNEVLKVQGEFDDLWVTLPPDIKEADLSKKQEVKGELETLVKGHFGGWSRMVAQLLAEMRSGYKTRVELGSKIQEYVGGFLAGFGDASPGGLTQLYTRMADQALEELEGENPLAANETDQQWLVTAAMAGRLGGIWTGFALAVPFVGPALAGLGRFFASWASKGNKLRALYDGGAEWAFLQALQAGLFLLANPVAGAIIGLTGSIMATLGFIGGRITTKLTDGGAETVEKLEGFNEDIVEQNFKPPTVITKILEYLAQPDAEKTS